MLFPKLTTFVALITLLTNLSSANPPPAIDTRQAGCSAQKRIAGAKQFVKTIKVIIASNEYLRTFLNDDTDTFSIRRCKDSSCPIVLSAGLPHVRFFFGFAKSRLYFVD